ncbi:APC family permease [Nonomuraea sp. NPDC048901]|uniref:APC family permease n=1 Tax=Nonomuraea sp. NPDC048901 TaxID=3155627 RepID=UPI0033CE66F0
MTYSSSPDSPQTSHPARSGGLRPDAVGLVGLTVLGAVMMSPAMGIYGTWGPMEGMVGQIVPLVFLAALIISLPNALSYIIVNREMPSTGAAFTWTWRTSSPIAGLLVGLVAIAYYITQVILQPLLFGLFFNDLLRAVGVETGTWTLLFGAALVTVVVCMMTYRGIQASTKSAVTFLIIETAVLLALCATILITRGIDHELSLSPFLVSEGQGGLPAFWTAVLLGVLSFTGFDVISTLAEEAHTPRRLLPKATLLAVSLVGLVWVFATWAFALSEPPSTVSKYNAMGLTAVTPMARDYWGWGHILIIITAMTALTGIYVATVLGASRMIYAIARQDLLPSPLARLHPRSRVPHNAMTLVYLVSASGAGGMLVLLGNAVDAFVWWSQVVVFLALILYSAVNLANLLFFARIARARRRWLSNAILPVAGIVLNLYVIYRSFFLALWDSDFRLGKSVVIAALATLAIFVAYAVVVRLRAPGRLRGDPITD